MEEIFVPASGMALEEVTLVEWLSQPGDEVAAGQPVALVETDKAMVELSGESAGRLGRHLFETGTQVQPGVTIAYVLLPGESEPGTAEDTSLVTPLDVGPTDTPAPLDATAAPDTTESAPSEPDAKEPDAKEPDAKAPEVKAPEVKAPNRLSPRQRRAAAAAQSGAEDSPAAPADQPLVAAERSTDTGDGFRRAIADAVAQSWATIPHFAVGREVSADGLRSALARAKASGPGVTVTDFLLSAFAEALDADGHPADVGLAVATEWGVIIPVVADVTGCSIEEIATRRRAAVTRARGRRLASGDAVVPYATLSNLGPFGVSWFTGIIPLGQIGLLTVGAIAERVVVSGGGIRVQAQFSATFTADHRHLDGVQSAELLGRFAGAVEALHQEDVS